MSTYTYTIESPNEDETIWQAVIPTEVTEYDFSADQLVSDIAGNQNVVDRDDVWRIRVWEGDRRDTDGYGADPVAEVYNRPGHQVLL